MDVERRGGGGGGRAAAILTRGAPVEVVVILGDVRQDAEAVGDLERHHVFGVQQGRNPQLLLGHGEGLGDTRTSIGPPEPTGGIKRK